MDSNILKLQLCMNKTSTGKFHIMWGSGPSCCCPYSVCVYRSSSVYLICSMFTLDHYFFAPPALCLHPEHPLLAPVNSASKPSHVRYFTLIFQFLVVSNYLLFTPFCSVFSSPLQFWFVSGRSIFSPNTLVV